MVQTRSKHESTASEPTHTKVSKTKNITKATSGCESREKETKQTTENGTESSNATVPEKRKRDDKEGQPPPHPSKMTREEGDANETKDEKPTGNQEEEGDGEGGGEERPLGATVAHKIRKTIDEYGTVPLEGLGVDKPLEPTPEILLAMVIDSMLKCTRISHNIAQETSIKVFEAGYYDIEILSNTSWDDRVQVLSEGGYNRYRETTATKLGDLAHLVNEKYGMLIIWMHERNHL